MLWGSQGQNAFSLSPILFMEDEIQTRYKFVILIISLPFTDMAFTDSPAY